MNKFHVYSFSGRPVVALSTGSRVARIAGLKRMHPITKKRTAHKYLVLAVTAGRLSKVIAPAQPLSQAIPGFDFDAWKDLIEQTLGYSDLEFAVMWPSDAAKQRIYVHVLDRLGRDIAFAKVNYSGDDSLITRELDTLGRLHGGVDGSYQAPRQLGLVKQGVFTTLLMSHAPTELAGSRTAPQLNAQRIVSAIQGTIEECDSSCVDSLSWWREYQAVAPNSVLGKQLSAGIVEDGQIRVCRVHGDLGEHNLVKTQVPWIVDWEESAADAPFVTDATGLYCSSARLHGKTITIAQIMSSVESIMGVQVSRTDILAALAFRLSRGIVDPVVDCDL